MKVCYHRRPSQLLRDFRWTIRAARDVIAMSLNIFECGFVSMITFSWYYSIEHTILPHNGARPQVICMTLKEHDWRSLLLWPLWGTWSSGLAHSLSEWNRMFGVRILRVAIFTSECTSLQQVEITGLVTIQFVACCISTYSYLCLSG